MIATFRKNWEYVQKWKACQLLQSLQHSNWTATGELNSQRRTSLHSIGSSSFRKLASHNPRDQTWYCLLWWCVAIWLYATSRSTGSNIDMASILPWHTSQWCIYLDLWRVAGNHCIFGFGATHLRIRVIGRHARATVVLSSNVSSHPSWEVLQCRLSLFESQWTCFGDQVCA